MNHIWHSQVPDDQEGGADDWQERPSEHRGGADPMFFFIKCSPIHYNVHRSFDKQADFFLVQPSHNYHWGIFSRVRCPSSSTSRHFSSWSKFMRKIASGFIYLVIIVFFLQVCSDLYDGSHMVNSLQLEHQARSSCCQKVAREINLGYVSLFSLLVGKLVKQSDKN